MSNRSRARIVVLLIAAIALVVGGVAYAVAPSYTPPCTANTDACRQTRIVALESKAANLEGRIQALETPSATVSPTPSQTPTTVPPTTIPPTTVPPTTDPPAPGSWPDASTTGVPAGTTLTAYTGPTTITAAGTVITNKTITSCLVINAANVQILRSRISCVPGRDGTAVANNSTGLLLQDVEVDGGGHTGTSSTCGIAIGYDHFQLSRVLVHGCSDGIRADGVVTMTDSYVAGLWATPNDHADGIQAYQGAGDMLFRHNRIDGRTQDRCCETSPIFIADGYQGTVTIDNNWFAGGGFSIRLHENGSYIVTGNRVLDGSYQQGPADTDFGIILTWTNNKLISATGVDGADI